MELHLKIIGVLLMVLALVHVIFPKYFNWKEELSRLSLINKQMMEIHTLFVAVAVFLIGLLSFTNSSDLVNTPLGKTIALGIAVFWSLRLLIQFFGYSSELWKGKRFETFVHILFSMLWTYLSVVYWMIYLG